MIYLVIDASVAHAAGDKEGVSQACKDFLEATRSHSYGLAATPTLLAEWRRTSDRQKRQPSRFISVWLTDMVQRGRVQNCPEDHDDELWGVIASAVAANRKENTLPSMQKDFHLIQAALTTDQRIASLDERARNHYRNVAPAIAALASIAWVNPSQAEESAIAWLQQGAPIEEHGLGSGG